MQVSQAKAGPPSLSTRVLETVADKRGCTPIELERPLFDAIDPDALDALFSGDSRSGAVEFSYLGYRIIVSSEGDVTVEAR